MPVGPHVDRQLPDHAGLAAPAWRPYARGDLARRALDTAAGLGALLVELEEPADPAQLDVSLSRGAAGRALALSHLDAAVPGRGFGEAARAALRGAIGAVGAQPVGPGLMQGFTGVAWVVAHLSDGAAGATQAVDEMLRDLLRRDAWRGGYDHVSGLVGVAVYALESGDAELLGLVVDALARLAERRDGGATWFTPPEDLHPDARRNVPYGYYNLGMAHGVAGVIASLAGATSAGIDGAAALLDDAVAWLERQVLVGEVALWPFFVGRAVDVRPARLAWCYGDPGITLALIAAGGAREREDWLALANRAIDLMHARAYEASGVTGASLCHGSAGLAHLCGRLHAATGRRELAEMARHWCERTLELRVEGQGLGGYSVWDPFDPDEVGGDVQGPGFLAGVAGVALVLAAAASDAPPAWDRCLLMSQP